MVNNSRPTGDELQEKVLYDIIQYLPLDKLDLEYSNNINQIAKRVNTTSIIYKDDVEDLKSLLENQAKDIFSIRKKIYSLTNSNSINTEKE